MAASRRRSSGFTEKPKPEVEVEVEGAKQQSDEVETEMFETISQNVEEPAPAVEEIVEPAIAPVVNPPTLAPRPVLPRKHPRNVPRFSRTSK